ncbi:MAG: DUF3717 domain-containing protein [Pseudomonadota bacterium]
MTRLHITELEVAINRCRAAMRPSAGLQAHFNALATLYGTMIYARHSDTQLCDLDCITREAIHAWMLQPEGSGAGNVLATPTARAGETP